MENYFFSDTQKNQHIKEYLDKKLAQYAKVNYGYFMMDKRNTDNIVIISDLPDYFADVYLENKQQNIDPIIINSLNRVSSFQWDENLMINSQWKLTTIFDTVKPHYNIVSGQTFILHTPDNTIALLSLYVNRFLMPDINDNITNHRDEIQGLLIHVYEMLIHLYNEKKDKTNPIHELTSRETEILYWSGTGKTYTEIAHILNITVSTVKFHMSKVVKKLGVKNAKHAISLSIELNIIPDKSKR